MKVKKKRQWVSEDGFPVRGRTCHECPQVGCDKTDAQFIRDWFHGDRTGSDTRFYCHAEGSSYQPSTDQDRGCRGFYAAAKRLGVYDPAAGEIQKLEGGGDE